MNEAFHKAKMKDVSRARSMAATLKKYALWSEAFKLDEYPDIFMNLSNDFYALSEAMRDAPAETPTNVIDIHDHLRKCGKG